MPVDRDTVQHTIFISRWRWILEHFPCVEHIGIQNLLQILQTLIPISNFRVLIQEQKCSSTEDFFITLRTLGNEYNIHIRIQRSIARLNTQLAARLNREAHAQTPPSPYSGGASSSSSSGGGTSSSKGQSDKRPDPFSKANTVKLTEEVPSSTSLIFDTEAEHSFVPPSIPIFTSSPHDFDRVLMPDGNILPVSGCGVLVFVIKSQVFKQVYLAPQPSGIALSRTLMIPLLFFGRPLLSPTHLNVFCFQQSLIYLSNPRVI